MSTYKQALVSSFLSAVLISGQASAKTDAEVAETTFRFKTPDGITINVPCDYRASTKEFMEVLDSRIHGYSQNMYSATAEEREIIFRKRLGFMSEQSKRRLLPSMERSYAQYGDLPPQQQKIGLGVKLEKNHGMTPERIDQLDQTCELLEP